MKEPRSHIKIIFMAKLIKKFNQIGIHDVSNVGGKNASLGELITTLGKFEINVPDGFATTADAFWEFLDSNSLRHKLSGLMDQLDRTSFSNLKTIGQAARDLILGRKLPDNLADEIKEHYLLLCGDDVDIDVAVRSSATAEDLPNASFAGQHESYLNVKGVVQLLEKVKRCYASLYTDRAIKYREDNKFEHSSIALSVGVQKMVRSDQACSGIVFTIEPEWGFENVIHLSGVWGLGEGIVQGDINPDEFIVFKPALAKGKFPIIRKSLGSKEKMMIYASGKDENTCFVETSEEKRTKFVLSDDEVQMLSHWALTIEEHYGKHMDIEWAKDGVNNKLYIIQARPETVHSQKKSFILEEYTISGAGKCIASGQAVGSKAISGVARILHRPEDAEKLKDGEVVVTDITSPDWDPALKRSAGIVTNKGGRTSHASIVARELGVPAIVGTGDGTHAIKDGQEITLSCCEGETGRVYDGRLNIEKMEINLVKFAMPESTEVMLIAADPDAAFKLSRYPNDGIGLMRLEFIITHQVQVHPMALIHFDQIKSEEVKKRIERITAGYNDKKAFFVEKLAEGIAMLAAAVFPKDVIVRMSDFKSNEYANLIGGADFEPKEENPMIGFRGASRYYNPLYKPGFELECKAILRVREKMGFTNVKVMIPFCRTPEEGAKVVDVMKSCGLDREKDKTLEIYVMAEIPSNVLQAGEFAEIFDGFSIGSNDLTQLTLGIDRDSSLVADLFDENNSSAKYMIATMIEKAKSLGRKIGLCGQAPSDYPDFAGFLVEKGIDSISFNPDAIAKGVNNIRKAERKNLVGK